MDKLVIKKCAQKMLFNVNDNEIKYIQERFFLFDNEINKLLKLDLTKYISAFYPCVKNFYELRQDQVIITKDIKVKNVLFKTNLNNEK